MALAESDGRGESTAPDTELASPPPPSLSRRRGVTSVVLLIVGLAISMLSLLVLYSCWHDDRDITNHIGRADADVLSVVFNRTAVRFVTPDGTVYIPPSGVLYPEGLAAGERVKVEYDTLEPNMVRVAGRDFTLAFLPVGSTILGTWVVVTPLLWWLRRPKRN
ncbi:MAG TPA: DUF3592 domain-containing protein [Pseudonocardiaceae bacterium]|nr:DUF3592 domain-containing protein [Pseudonocardiaceae bacterium]